MTPTTHVDDAPDFVVIDVETACSRVSSICQIGVVGFRDGRETFAWETLVDPSDEFHAINSRIHGIAAHHVAGQPTFLHVHAMVDAHLAGRVTVAHSSFDKGALAAACRVHDRPVIEARWLDSVRVARRAWPELANHRLGGLARFLGIPHRHHDALSDARAAGWVIVKAIDHTGVPLADWLTPPRRSRGAGIRGATTACAVTPTSQPSSIRHPRGGGDPFGSASRSGSLPTEPNGSPPSRG